MLKARICGVETTHSPGFIYKTNACHADVLIIFRTPYFVVVGEKRYEGEPGDVILHRRGSKVSHGHRDIDGIFADDWIYFDDPNGEVDVLGLPFDTPIRMGDADALASHIRTIMREKSRADEYSKRMISDILFRMFVKVKRADNKQKNELGIHFAKFNSTRLTILANYAQPWTLKSMAQLSGYSVSRFCSLYNAYFGISPMNDLLEKRIEVAKQLLLLDGYRIGDIAELCGFSSIHYFSNYFKKKTGKSPAEFHNC